MNSILAQRNDSHRKSLNSRKRDCITDEDGLKSRKTSVKLKGYSKYVSDGYHANAGSEEEGWEYVKIHSN